MERHHMNNRQLGSLYEDKAKEYLESLGMITLERNFRTRDGEIDLIMEDAGTLVFVEVKYRKTARSGYAVEAVTLKKQQQIRKIAREYLATHSGPFRPIRFDCIGYTGEERHYIRNAF